MSVRPCLFPGFRSPDPCQAVDSESLRVGFRQQEYLFCLSLFIYFERQTERVGKRGGGAERRRESRAGSVLSVQSPTQGLNSRTTRSWPELKSRVRSLTSWASQMPLDNFFFNCTHINNKSQLWKDVQLKRPRKLLCTNSLCVFYNLRPAYYINCITFSSYPLGIFYLHKSVSIIIKISKSSKDWTADQMKKYYQRLVNT